MAVPVSLRGVVKRFGDTVAVDHIDLEVPAGEFFFLLGPSGCGKSTALRLVAGFYHPDDGDIHFGGRPMLNVPPHRRNTGMVFQNYALWPHMTVFQNVEYGLSVRKVQSAEKEKRVRRMLEVVRMEEYADRTPNQLSGGQQQRIALARALVIDPDVLLLDEPLSNLDAKLRDDMRQELKRIHAQSGRTALYVTHDQKEALSLAHRVAVMRDGHIVQVGTPREIYSDPVDAFVAGFIGATNFLDGRVASSNGDGVEIESKVGIIRAKPSSRVAEGQQVTVSVRPESVFLSAENSGAINEIESSVIGATYFGNHEEYELALKDGPSVRAMIHNPGHVEYHQGDRVYVSFSPSDAISLPGAPPDPSDLDAEVV